MLSNRSGWSESRSSGLGFIGSENVTGTIPEITVTAVFLILPLGDLVPTLAVFESSLRWWERAVALVLALFCGGLGPAVIFNVDTISMARVADSLFDDALDFFGAVLVAFK